MTRVIARLILCQVVILSAPAIYFITLVFLISGPLHVSWRDAMGLTTLITVSSFTITWLVLWLGSIKWTGVRISQTLGVWLASIIVAAVIGGIINKVSNENVIRWICGSMTWLLLWLAGTTFIWRESKSERLLRLKNMGTDAMACPSCGYNLTGLREAKCPECGSQFTLDQLFASINEQRADIN